MGRWADGIRDLLEEREPVGDLPVVRHERRDLPRERRAARRAGVHDPGHLRHESRADDAAPHDREQSHGGDQQPGALHGRRLQAHAALGRRDRRAPHAAQHVPRGRVRDVPGARGAEHERPVRHECPAQVPVRHQGVGGE